MTNFCENCEDEINQGNFRFGEYNKLCCDCYDEFNSSHFECDVCNKARENDDLVEDVAYSNTEHTTCMSCFIHRVLDTLPAPTCECGKYSCPIKNPNELDAQLDKKTELYEDETPTKHSFHQDCCKGCSIAALLATRTITYDNQRVGFLMRLKLGNDPSALINRFLGGTAVSKLIRLPARRLKQHIRSIRYSDDDEAPSPISYMSAQAAQYEMRDRYENDKKRKIHNKTILQRLFEARLELLDE
jgi:hypothetical protein